MPNKLGFVSRILDRKIIPSLKRIKNIIFDTHLSISTINSLFGFTNYHFNDDRNWRLTRNKFLRKTFLLKSELIMSIKS